MVKRKRHNHQVKIYRLIHNGALAWPQPGQVSILNVYHDDSCAIWAGGLCDCDPDITQKPSKPVERPLL